MRPDVFKKPVCEVNHGISSFVPRTPTTNPALAATELPGYAANQVTIEQMRDVPEVFDNKHGGLDKTSIVRSASARDSENLKRSASNINILSKQLGKRK